jgi:uncharacterized membrane protein YcaP (DUF421 family)
MLAGTFHDMFVLDPTAVTIAEKMLRPVVVYVFLIVGLRLAGKRELAQVNPFDFVVLMTLSNTVQNAIIGNDNSVTGGILGATTLLAINYAVVRIIYRNRKLGRIIEGRADVLMSNGRINRDHLARELICQEELQAAAHRQGIGSLHEVEKCLLEPNGTITFIQKQPTPDSERHAAIMQRLGDILEHLRAAQQVSPHALSQTAPPAAG